MGKCYSEKIETFLIELKKAGIEKIIAFSGSVPDEKELDSIRIVEESFEVYKNFPIAIQTGGTNFDIQKYAAKFAKKYNMPFIGVYPSKGEKYKIPDMDFAIEVTPRFGQSEWGDDSEIFSKLPHGVEMIGGSMGTLIEFGHLMKINDAKARQKQKQVYIAPVLIRGSKMFTDMIHAFELKPYQKACLSEKPFTDGKTAAEFLIKKVYD